MAESRRVSVPGAMRQNITAADARAAPPGGQPRGPVMNKKAALKGGELLDILSPTNMEAFAQAGRKRGQREARLQSQVQSQLRAPEHPIQPTSPQNAQLRKAQISAGGVWDFDADAMERPSRRGDGRRVSFSGLNPTNRFAVLGSDDSDSHSSSQLERSAKRAVANEERRRSIGAEDAEAAARNVAIELAQEVEAAADESPPPMEAGAKKPRVEAAGGRKRKQPKRGQRAQQDQGAAKQPRREDRSSDDSSGAESDAPPPEGGGDDKERDDSDDSEKAEKEADADEQKPQGVAVKLALAPKHRDKGYIFKHGSVIASVSNFFDDSSRMQLYGCSGPPGGP